ncbi:GspH/FimT family pseudopilin [Marilutibacter aestuarii]|uniref:Type II secretion system protein H n=1 Tax=Marilutibacter aestuarii TaxID=1706195 RepID=A0A508B070_9GAMM|nr:GspH/FimT family pseudopilin [Lysobacter aestuarii]TQD51552.1 prepilin-type N-terminal cleavage/methylation domain-containing protein [Lysobacter aestuarii]
MRHANDRRRGGLAGPARGFTLVELMITVVVMGVLLAIGVPSFRYVQNSARISAPANELVASVQLARAEAIRRNGRMALCSSSDGATCAAGGAWNGWIVFADADRNGAVTAGEEILRRHVVEAPVVVEASPALADGVLTFRSDGFARDSAGDPVTAAIGVCVAATIPTDNVRNVTLGAGSRAFIERTSGNGACAQPADP